MKNLTKIFLAFVLGLGAFSTAHANKWEVREDDNSFDCYIDDSNVLQVCTLAGLAGTATALAANGSNCSAGQAPLGVDASGAVESCFDVQTAAEQTTHEANASIHHTATVNTDAESKCAATQYLEGDGTCDVLSVGAHTAVDDTPDNGDTTSAPTSNWAFDHDADAAAHHTATASGDITHDSTVGGTTGDAHFDHADDLAELNSQISSALVTGAHTTDTGPSPDCSGTTTYQDGEGGCDDISSVYQAADAALTALASAFWGRDTTANICAATPAAIGDFAISSDNGDQYNAYGVTPADWRNGRTGIICP